MDSADVDRLLFGLGERARFTQDTPVLPEVWYAFAADPHARHDVLISPLDTISANALLLRIVDDLGDHAVDARPAALRGFVAAALTFDELVQVILPRSTWAQDTFGVGGNPDPDAALLRSPAGIETGLGAESRKRRRDASNRAGDESLFRLMGEIGADREFPRRTRARALRLRNRGEAVRDFESTFRAAILQHLAAAPSVWRVALNRRLELSDEQARRTVKGDAAHRVFDVQCGDLVWAVIDSGIDATHPAFNDGGTCRILASYDFVRLRDLLNAAYRGRAYENPALHAACDFAGIAADDGAELLEAALSSYDTDVLDWASIEPLIRLNGTLSPVDGHGTHVAGIIAANWREDDGEPIVVGMCPDIRLMDLRVVANTVESTEVAVIYALQFLRHLNSRNQYIAVHGANLSISIPHAVENYACGRTPVCEESERLVGTGVTVVAAAGNRGWRRGTSSAPGRASDTSGYSVVSITDPGNAETVITVGATHRREPHTYGVSYFSSRGPTGDGRAKPDLLAPGERIRSTLPGREYGTLDGTSQAAPHVSGAAALLMARFPELIGQAGRVKTLLCGSATDLGRERMFQGSGLLDALKALQSF